MESETRTQASASVSAPDTDSRDGLGPAELWSWLPRLPLRQLRLEQRLRGWHAEGGLPPALGWLETWLGAPVVLGPPEAAWRASGLKRPGLIAQFRWPRLNTRMAIGLEVPLAHLVVDRLLGFDRPFAESRLQITPVEWGVWTYLIVRALDQLDSAMDQARPAPAAADPLGSWDLTLDRVGPDPFDPTGLGSLVTIRWPVRLGETSAAVRLWLPESLVSPWLSSRPWPIRSSLPPASAPSPSMRELAGDWRAEAGFVSMSQGLRRLRIGGVLPLTETRLTGTPRSPQGMVALVCELGDGAEGRFLLPAEPAADSGGRLIRLTGSLTREPQPREPLSLNARTNQAMNDHPNRPESPVKPPAPDASPLDIPVTLTVELGRVNLTLDRLASLKPGDVVELGRHSREPVELTSNGRLVARGELVLIDTELGVRVTNVFL